MRRYTTFRPPVAITEKTNPLAQHFSGAELAQMWSEFYSISIERLRNDMHHGKTTFFFESAAYILVVLMTRTLLASD
jgi:hypothetical protein